MLVLEASPGGPAAKAGVRSTTRDESGRLRLGDVITAIDGSPVKSSADLYKVLDRHGVGDVLVVRVERVDMPPAELRIVLEDRESLARAAAQGLPRLLLP